MPKILIADDKPSMVDALVVALSAEGFQVGVTGDGVEALAVVDRDRPDLVLLDHMLPGLAGTEVCKRIRANSALPIIMLTARDSELDRVLGLELGADDYVTKPFSTRELVARIRAVLRRSADWDTSAIAAMEVGDVRLDVERHEVYVRGTPVALRPKEFALLALLVSNPGRVLSRDLILGRIWGSHDMRDTKTLDVHIKRLRSHVEVDAAAPKLILTTRGVGYRFADG